MALGREEGGRGTFLVASSVGWELAEPSECPALPRFIGAIVRPPRRAGKGGVGWAALLPTG